MSNTSFMTESSFYPILDELRSPSTTPINNLTPGEEEEYVRCPFREFNGEFLRCYKNDCMAYYKNQNNTYLCSRLNPIDGSKLVNLDKKKE